jgi:hypothetical protein
LPTDTFRQGRHRKQGFNSSADRLIDPDATKFWQCSDQAAAIS